MKFYIIAVGQKMPKWVSTGFEEYAKRMPKDFAIELIEIKPEPRTQGKTVEQMMSAESKRILNAIPHHCHCIALDEHGEDLTTLKLSKRLHDWQYLGQDIALIIGGPDGLDKDLKQSCQELIRLSSLTLPHPMVRILLAEQLYRAWSILHHHPYHRA
ncbi:23S rRNA (pseudouridine(1915)-N(3))-methyltransferase RlmH [Basilea psittacipulmonis]|uniref:Ribosomal RNA large subunit methyltransferase H n=1 Tax=Basilea psittacipulmonis DSM 24701 TaxID=1072685 RepID=A0A077DD42_9BURK|nr:23S rRNA (pseudouridine(1915)-N(3))-methyltransferase RlmH [Basilea psittacipulmonis]AIL32750.1 50S rRNA methyltransferase [Basilea psittacipulmonis DSM 24701]